MNRCLYELFLIPEKRERFAKGLPTAFDMVRRRMPPGNPAVGILREHVIVGFLEVEFGRSEISVPKDGVERGYDVELCGEKLSIKTRTGAGGFKILWTVDTDYVKRELREGHPPEHDILLVNIHWQKTANSVFYIPVEVQKNVLNSIGQNRYLSSATGTNNRGIEIQGMAAKLLRNHPSTFRFQVNWRVAEKTYPTPWEEWANYWREV